MSNTTYQHLRHPHLWAAMALLGLPMFPSYAQERARTNPPPTAINAPASPARGSSTAHTVQKGETLDSVCKKFNIGAANCLQVSYFNKLVNNQLPPPSSIVYIPLNLLPAQPLQVRLVQTAGNVQINGQEAKAGIRLKENTRIVTAADSSAVIELADESRVKILPSSIADIVQSRSYMAPEETSSGKLLHWIGSKIRIVQGAIESTVKKKTNESNNKSVEVETATSLIGVRGTQFRVASADRFVPYDRTEVLDGSVSNINTWKESEIYLNAAQGAVVNPNKAEMQAITLLPAPEIPAKGQIVRHPHAYWTFHPVSGAVAYHVIAANDADFDSILFSEKTILPQADLSRLENGIWHIRARAVDAQGLEGLNASSTIDLRQPAWVLHNASIQYVQNQLFLSWTDIATVDFKPLTGTTTVYVEIARTNTFAPPLTSLKTTGNELALPRLGPGHYYLRIGVENGPIKNNEQQVFTFELTANAYNMAYNILLRKIG